MNTRTPVTVAGVPRWSASRRRPIVRVERAPQTRVWRCSRVLPPQMLDENHHLIQCILDYQSKGKTAECAQ